MNEKEIEVGSISHNMIIIEKSIERIKNELRIRGVDTSFLDSRTNIFTRAIDRVVKINKVIPEVRLCPLKKTQQKLCTGNCKHCQNKEGSDTNGS